jgi:hypothetical protein
VNAVQHLRDYGTFSPVNRDRGHSRSRRILDLEPEILQPNVSCRRLALRIGLSSFTIWRTLHEQRVQHLKPEDPPRRIAFCQWFLQKIDEEPNFLSIVLTTDEAGFTRDGVLIRIIPTSGQKKIHTKSENVVSNKDSGLTCGQE